METVESKKWKTWRAVVDEKTCENCRRRHGKIYEIDEFVSPFPPLHYFCRCKIVKLRAILAGNATELGAMGADWWLKYYGELPDYYITVTEAYSKGWRREKGNLNVVAPKCMIFGGVFQNVEGKLPDNGNRIWYEADINYRSGKRNNARILFSDDGLIFVTYNHYETFYEIK